MPDDLYMNGDGAYYSSVKWNDDYGTFNGRLKEWQDRGYQLDNLKRLRAVTARKVDFDLLYRILSSSDEQMLKDHAWIFEDCQTYPKFLASADQSESGKSVTSTGNHVAYVTFPRVGNTFMRKIFQNVTGLFTGADMPLEVGVHFTLKGMAEEITDDTVWMKKSHFPMLMPTTVVHKSNKAIVCVRNPYDAFVSMMHFIPHQVQSATIKEHFLKDIRDMWEPFLKSMVVTMKKTHEVAMKISQ